LQKLRAAQFDVVESLAGEFASGETTSSSSSHAILRNAVYFLPIWRPLCKQADNSWAASVHNSDDAARIHAHLYNQVCVAGSAHPFGAVCAEFRTHFETKFSLLADFAGMHAELFVFFAALANGVCATLSELTSVRQQVVCGRSRGVWW
jgi:hypothetical protein